MSGQGLRPATLFALLVLAAALGAGIFAGVQRLFPRSAAVADRAATEAVVREYVLSHPEILPEAMQRLQEREQNKAVSANKAAITTPFAGAWTGNPQGDVTLVAYLDYNCGYCRTSIPAIERLLAEDKGLRVVYRELPILAPSSRSAAERALAAAVAGRFTAYHRALYRERTLDEAAFARAADAAGLDAEALRRAAGSQAIAGELAGNLAQAQALGITGTPAWVVGDRMLSGAVGYEGLKAAVDAARAG